MNIKSSSLLTSSETILTRPINNNVEENNKAAKSKTINANNTNINKDPIEEKKKQARKNAMRIMRNAFLGEKSIDDELKERKQNIQNQSRIMDENLSQMKNIEAEREAH